jgi:hypothetical protein
VTGVRLDQDRRPCGAQRGDRVVGRVAPDHELHRVAGGRGGQPLPRHHVAAADSDDDIAEPQLDVLGRPCGGDPERLGGAEQVAVERHGPLDVGGVQVRHRGQERHQPSFTGSPPFPDRIRLRRAAS